VETLRGTSGSDFEGYAQVLRGHAPAGCGCIFFGSSHKKDKFVMLKGPYCFVFQSESSSSPQYAISLCNLTMEYKDAVAVLQTNLGDIDYELRFQDPKQAESFCEKARALAASGQAEEVRVRLGHEHLLHPTKSIMFAKNIAEEKLDDQPSAPLSNTYVLANIVVAPM